MKTLKLITLITAITIMYSCNKHNDEKVVSLDGTYSGQVTQHITMIDNTVSTVSNNVVVKLGSPKYSTYISIQSNDPTAEGGYKISNSQVTFADSLFLPESYQYMAVLNGSYAFKVKADSLILTQVVSGYNTIYRLKKQ